MITTTTSLVNIGDKQYPYLAFIKWGIPRAATPFD